MLFLQILLGICISTTGVLSANITGNSSIFDDRININTNYGHAHAVGKDGSFAGSDTSSLGFNAGILYPGNRYTPLAAHTSSKSNAYSSGRKPPSAYSQSGVQQNGRYGIKGNAAAGYSGGVGQAYTKSQSQQYAIPLGLGGAVILSNLPEEAGQGQGSKGSGEETDKKKHTESEDKKKPSSDPTPADEKLFLNN